MLAGVAVRGDKSPYHSLMIEAVVHPHCEGPQCQTEHDTCRDELDHIDGVDAGESWSADDYRKRKQPHGKRDNDVSPGGTTIRHNNESISRERALRQTTIDKSP